MKTPIDHEAVERFRAQVTARFGFALDDTKLPFLREVLEARVAATRAPDVSAYFATLSDTHHAGSAERRAVAERLTVTETYFFRYGDQCRAFAEYALPARIATNRDTRTLRILSAGSSSGEEAYTIAMTLRDRISDLSSWRVEITAIDLNVAMLDKARRARYSAWSLRDTSVAMRERYFHTQGAEFVLDERVRTMVTFAERNLTEDDAGFWLPDVFDVVFCRNVTMYFAPEVTRAVIARIARSLAPGGFLFLGHAETLRGLSSDFHLRHSHDAFFYELRDAHDTTRGAPLLALPSRERPASNDARAVPGAAIADDAAWVEVIRDATERIAKMTGPTSYPVVAHAARAPDLARALALLEAERFAEAIDQLDALPTEERADPDVRLLRAVLLTNGGRIDEAAGEARALLADDALCAGAHYVMALCLDHRGEHIDAIAHDRVARHLDPTFAMPSLHLGFLARRLDDGEGAKRAFTEALDLLAREDASRILLFGGGFSREALCTLCRGELRTLGGAR